MALLGDFGPTIKRNYTYASDPKIGVLVVIYATNDAKEEEEKEEEKGEGEEREGVGGTTRREAATLPATT